MGWRLGIGCLILTILAYSGPARGQDAAPALEAAPAATAPEITPSGMTEYKRSLNLSLDDARKFAVEHNPDLENARRDLQMAELDIVRTMANYDPYVRVDASYSKSQKPSSQAAFGQTSDSASVTVGTGANTATGGSLSLDFRNSRSESDSIFSTLNPSYSTDLTLSVRQPLLRGRYDNVMEMDLDQKNNDYQRTLLALRSKELEIEAAVEDAYWSLYRSRLDLDLKRRSYELSGRMDQMTKAQVRAGTQPAVSTLQTEANLASANSSLIRGENEYRKNQNSFKMTLNLFDPALVDLEIIPADTPRYQPPDFEREKFLVEAMANNFSLRQKRFSFANSRIGLMQSENRALPQLDARASVGVSGLAGTSNPTDSVVETGFVVPNPLPPDQSPAPYIVERVVVQGTPSDYEGGYIDALENMGEGDNLSWSAGVTYQVPVGNRAAKADVQRSRISHERQLDDLRYQEQQTFINLINLINDVDASHRNLLAAQEASRLQAKNLETEEKKFRLGLNTSYEVMQAEDNYMESRSSEVGAMIEYAKVLNRVDRAREGYLSGATSSMTISAAGLPSGISGGGMPSGLDQSMIQQYSSMLPAGVDINSLMGLIQ